MSANQSIRMCGAVDQEVLEQAIRENLSPEGVAAIVAFSRPASTYSPSDERAREAFAPAKRQLEWFVDTLVEMIGVPELNRLMDELGL